MKAHQKVVRDRVAETKSGDLFGNWWNDVDTDISKAMVRETTQATAKNKFQKSGKKFTSPYAKKRIGGSSTSAKPRPTRAKFSSAYKKNSSQSTTRNSSSRTSRSGRRGK